MNLWGGQQNITKASFPARTLKLIENSMINLYNVAKKVILINPFSNPYKNVPYTALFYHTMTLNDFIRVSVQRHTVKERSCLYLKGPQLCILKLAEPY